MVRLRAGWLRLGWAACFAVASVFSFGQDAKPKPPVKVLESRISDKLSGKPIAGATVEVYKNGSLLETKTASSAGKYKISTLELDNQYKIVFKAPGYVSRFIEVDLRNIPMEDMFKKGWEVPLDMTLPEEMAELDFTPVKNKITSTLSYEKSTGEIEFNRSQLDAYNKELDKVLKKAEEAKKAEEKKKQEEQAKYDAAMKAADEAIKKNDYPGAIAEYNKALMVKKDDPTATAKLKDAEVKKTEWEKKNMAEKQYKENFDIAEAKYKQKDYDGAIEAYRKAKEFKNDPALDKKIKEVETTKETEGKAMKEKQFTDFYAAAEKAYKEKDYGSARDNYKKAFEVKPDPAVQKKITDLETLMKKQIEDQQKYEQFMADGNKAMLNSKWDDAIKGYQSALTVRADSKEAKDGLDKANAEKKKAGESAAAEAKKQADFQAAMKQGNDAMTAKKYDEAIAGFDKALGIIPDNADAKTKRQAAVDAKKAAEDAAAALKEKEKKEAEYKQFMADGDKMVTARDYENALANYENALKSKPGDPAATAKVASTKKQITDVADAQRKEKEYNDLRADADADFAAGKYEEAVTKYMKAKTFKADKYLDDQIAKAQKAIADAKAAEGKKKEFEAALAQGDKELAAKQFDLAIATYQKALATKFDDTRATGKIDEAKKQKDDFLAAEKNRAEQAKIEAEFLALVKKGDDELLKKNYAGAISNYEAALAKKEDSGVKTKLDNARKAKEDAEKALASAQEREQKYKEHIANGDAAMKGNDANTAVGEYQAALDLKAGDKVATDKLNAAKAIIAADLKKQKELEAANKKKYDDAIAKGDAEHTAGKFKEAIEQFNLALTVVPNDKAAQDRITKSQNAMGAREKELAEQYAKIMAQADKDFAAENYTDAKGYYERYLKFDKNNTHAAERIKECDLKIKDKAAIDAANAKKKAEFDAIVAKGDAEVKAKKYESAITFYNQALGVIADEPTAVKKRDDAQKMIDGLHTAEVNKKYSEALAKGDVERTAGKFTEAIEFYKKALEAKPGDAVAQARIDDANAKMASREKELAEQYAKIMAQADKDFDATNYADAKGYYERYLKFDKNNTHAAERIKECDLKIKEKAMADANYAKKKTEYDALVALGDKEVKEKKYDLAIATYTKAMAVLPDDVTASKKRDDAQRLKDELANADVMKRYNDFIAKGDGEATAGKFNEAIDYYNKALDVKPGDAAAQKKIDDARNRMENRKKELEEQYARILTQADKDFQAGNYQDAIGYYERYLTFNKDHVYSKNQITESKKLMAANADAAAKKKKYQELIATGDKQVAAKSFDDGIISFQSALIYMPNDPVALEKIENAKKLKADLINAAKNKAEEKERLAKYQAAFDAGMVASDGANFKLAINKFEEALTYKPGDKPATDMLAKVRLRQKEKESELDAMYQQIITQADKDFDGSNYKDALEYYKRASKFKPNEQYPKDRIAECENRLLTANRKHHEIEKEGEIVTNQTVIDALKMVEESKRQDKFKEEQRFVEIQDKQKSLDSAYAVRNEGNRFENKEELNRKSDEITQFRDRGAHEENAKEYIAINDRERQYSTNQTQQHAKDIYENKKEIDQNTQRMDEMFKGQDIYRQYKVDSTVDFIDTRNDALRSKTKDQTYAGYQQQKDFEEYSYNQSQLFKDMDKNYRGYKVDSVKAYKDNREEAYRNALHSDNKNAYDNQKVIEKQEENRTELFLHMDKQYRMYKVDSIYAFKDYHDETHRQALHADNNLAYKNQKNLEEQSDYRAKLYQDMDKNYRGYKVDSVKAYKDYRDETYRETIKYDNKISYENQKKLEQEEDYRSKLYQDMDKNYRGYKVDSVKAYKDYRDAAYNEASKDNSAKVYEKQQQLNTESDIRSTKNTVNTNNYLENSKEYIEKTDEHGKATEGYSTTGENKRLANNENFKKTAPVEPKEYNTGYLNELAAELGEGIHQWTYNKFDDKGKVSEVVIRRIVVKGITANDHKMIITKWGQHYMKNGKQSNEYTWNVETGGNIIEHDE